MVDNRELYNKLKDIRIELNNIKKSEEEVTKKYDNICNTCSHDYILVYS